MSLFQVSVPKSSKPLPPRNARDLDSESLAFLKPILPQQLHSPAAATELSNVQSAYDACVAFQAHAQAQARNSKSTEAIISARVLGCLILNAPTLAVRKEVVTCIHSCRQDNDKLFALGQHFLIYFVRAFKQHKGRTPTPSEHPSRPSFDGLKTQIKARLVEAPKSHKDAKDWALLRDRFRCVASLSFDYDHAPKFYTEAELDEEPGRFTHTNCAHILPEATYFNVTPGSGGNPDKPDYSASVLAVLQHFGYDINKLNGPGVHSLENVMTLASDVHSWFDSLQLWFEATGVKHHYKVGSIRSVKRLGVQPEVTFTTLDNELLPLPSPELLSLHATCAKVAHLSGAGEYIDKLQRDEEDTKVLSSDGSSGEILNRAFLPRIVGVGA